ncbi:MAG TPA: ABC transporter ATP-binding protein [Alphaproteobacteria bacterium]
MMTAQASRRDVAAAPDVVLRLNGVSKFYGAMRAVDRLSVDVRKGEVLTLLGPSGCGKSTTMRLVMGLEQCDEGEIVYQGKVVDSAREGTSLPVHKRQMGMVFQSYAIWPHMTVYDNVAYPLRVRRVRGDKLRNAVERALDLVGLAGFENRPAPNLSGGQQQRVALARSLVFEPQILLLDEPFSNLDAHLREQMRAEVRMLQRRLGITVLFVTHDQVEALSLSDRIVVMKSGRIEQVGTPFELYERPSTPAVRDFLGRTAMLAGKVVEQRDDGRVVIELAQGAKVVAAALPGRHLAAGTACRVAIRPEKIEIEPLESVAPAAQGQVLRAEIEMLLFIGDRFEARIGLPDNESLLVYLPASPRWHEGQSVALRLPESDVQVWPA